MLPRARHPRLKPNPSWCCGLIFNRSMGPFGDNVLNHTSLSTDSLMLRIKTRTLVSLLISFHEGHGRIQASPWSSPHQTSTKGVVRDGNLWLVFLMMKLIPVRRLTQRQWRWVTRRRPRRLGTRDDDAGGEQETLHNTNF